MHLVMKIFLWYGNFFQFYEQQNCWVDIAIGWDTMQIVFISVVVSSAQNLSGSMTCLSFEKQERKRKKDIRIQPCRESDGKPAFVCYKALCVRWMRLAIPDHLRFVNQVLCPVQSSSCCMEFSEVFLWYARQS